MNTIHLYVRTCRLVFQSNLKDPTVWKIHLINYLTSLRHELGCRVCGGLLQTPMGPARSVCHHYVCKTCVGGKPRYILHGCGWCKNIDEFVLDSQMMVIIRCFRKLCCYLQIFIAEIASEFEGDVSFSSVVAIINEVLSRQEMEDKLDTLEEIEQMPKLYPVRLGFNLPASDKLEKRRKRKRSGLIGGDDKTSATGRASGNSSPVLLDIQHDGFCHDTNQIEHFNSDVLSESGCSRDGQSSLQVASHESSYAPDSYLFDSEKKLESIVLAEHDYNKVNNPEASAGQSEWTVGPNLDAEWSKLTTSSSTNRDSHIKKQKQLPDSHSANEMAAIVSNKIPAAMKSSSSNSKHYRPKGKTGCRCAMATPNPGKLTCCGQRCPCYAAFKGCDNCKCRGCRNPRGDPSNIPPSLLKASVSGMGVQCLVIDC